MNTSVGMRDGAVVALRMKLGVDEAADEAGDEAGEEVSSHATMRRLTRRLSLLATRRNWSLAMCLTVVKSAVALCFRMRHSSSRKTVSRT